MNENDQVVNNQIVEENVMTPEPMAVDAPQPVRQKKVKAWMIAVPVIGVLLAGVLTVVLLWDAIYVRIAPSAVLFDAMKNTYSDLAVRSDGTLLPVLEKAVDENGRYTLEMDMSVAEEGYMYVDAAILTLCDIQNSQFRMDAGIDIGMYGAISLDADFGLYGDQEYLAANWKQAFGADYYGIAYDTFAEDIRANSLIYESIGEDTLLVLEDFLSVYREQMDTVADYGEGYTFNEAYVNILTDFFEERKPEVGTALLTLTGAEQKCWKITYMLTDEELAGLIEQFGEVMEEDEALKNLFDTQFAAYEDIDGELAEILKEVRFEYFESIQELADSIRESGGSSALSFFLYNEKVVNLEYAYTAEDTEMSASLMLGENSAEDDIVFLYTYEDAEGSGSLEQIYSVTREEASVGESISLTIKDASGDIHILLGYDWHRETGDLVVTIQYDDGVDTLDAAVDMKLVEEENGFTLELPELFGLMNAFGDDTVSDTDGMTFTVGIAMHAGAQISAPEYINIRELDEGAIEEMAKNLLRNYGIG